MEEGKNFKHIVRVVNTDLDGNKQVINALRKIKGVSFMFANTICFLAKQDRNQKVGYLKPEEIKKLEDVIKNPIKSGIPIWMFNRRRDMETNEDKHLLTSDLNFAIDNDIKTLKKVKTYKGTRHMAGLPARGQRTKSNFRKSKGKVMGVKRKAGAKSGRS